MLTLYKRHLKSCGNTDRFYRRCKCPMWVEGVHEGAYRRHSLKTNSWERAEGMKRDIERGADPTVTASSAIEQFENELVSRCLKESTRKKYRVLLSSLKEHCDRRGVRDVQAITPEELLKFRANWQDCPLSAVKKLERLRSFFRFCQSIGWVRLSPARVLKNPVLTDPPTMPFSEEEHNRLLMFARPRQHALFQILRYSGLRISDAMKLEAKHVVDGRLFLYTQKTGVPVYVPLPPFVVSELERLAAYGPYFFWNRQGESKLETATGNARRSFRRIAKLAKVPDAHPHRYRDTFAVSLLQAGVPLEDVSILLGHSDIRITQKHYSPWIRARQERLEQNVMKGWAEPKLVRVK